MDSQNIYANFLWYLVLIFLNDFKGFMTLNLLSEAHLRNVFSEKKSLDMHKLLRKQLFQ